MCGTCGCGSGEEGARILAPGVRVEGKNPNPNTQSGDQKGIGGLLDSQSGSGHRHDPGHHHHHHHHDTGHPPHEEHVHDHHHHHHDTGHPHQEEHAHTHSHSHTRARVIEVEQDVLRQNDLTAARNRGYFEGRNILALNLVSSPGSGKTAILERTLRDLKDEIPFYVIEGDQQTLNDANRIAALDIPVRQINTGTGCHLESDMVYKAVRQLDIQPDSVLMIENVGNLVCPSMFNLGERKRVVIISITEGEDKPIKYPDMFHSADICLINKMDLQPYVHCNLKNLRNYALQVNPDLEFFELSATTGEGMQVWYTWLREEFTQARQSGSEPIES